MALFQQHTGQLRAWARRTIWCAIVIGSLCAIVIPIFSIYRKEGDNSRAVVEVGPQGLSNTGDYIHVVGSVASVDFEDKNFRIHLEFTPHGTLAGDDGVLTAAIAVSLFYTTLTFPEAQIMRSVDVTMPYMQGATIDYPFDAYKSYFEILANKEKEQLHKIPISLTFLGMLQSVEFIPTVTLSNDDLYKISIEIFTRRSPTTIGFSLFIVMIMWALSIAIGIIAIQVIRKYRVTDEHVLTLGITTLFALPALRETQPGIPAIGCAADVLGFYWNMAIIAISSIMILMASALRWKEPSIEKEIELVHKQHDFQSKLISEMAIPMPFPLTGGPFFDYQLKKKRMPFLMNHHSHNHNHNHGYQHQFPQHQHHHSDDIKSLKSYLSSPLYSKGGHAYVHDNQDGYYSEDPRHPEYQPQMNMLQEQQVQEQGHVQGQGQGQVQGQQGQGQERQHHPLDPPVYDLSGFRPESSYSSSISSRHSLSTLTSQGTHQTLAAQQQRQLQQQQQQQSKQQQSQSDRQVENLNVQQALQAGHQFQHLSGYMSGMTTVSGSGSEGSEGGVNIYPSSYSNQSQRWLSPSGPNSTSQQYILHRR